MELRNPKTKLPEMEIPFQAIVAWTEEW